MNTPAPAPLSARASSLTAGFSIGGNATPPAAANGAIHSDSTGRGATNLKVLNLYAGLGGNRKLWTGCDVTAVELDPRIAAVYQRLHPHDNVIVGDAHQYLLDHWREFDGVWTSPPCPTHSALAKATRHALRRYPDMSLYQEIIFLKHFFKGWWVVENVVPFYEPLIPGKKDGRHMYWSNFTWTDFHVPTPPDFINLCNLRGKQALMGWLGIHYGENIYYGKNHCPAQILRNCVHPLMGEHIYKAALAHGGLLK